VSLLCHLKLHYERKGEKNVQRKNKAKTGKKKGQATPPCSFRSSWYGNKSDRNVGEKPPKEKDQARTRTEEKGTLEKQR
jgi:hypothetical protein